MAARTADRLTRLAARTGSGDLGGVWHYDSTTTEEQARARLPAGARGVLLVPLPLGPDAWSEAARAHRPPTFEDMTDE